MQLFVILNSEAQLSITSVSKVIDYFSLQEKHNIIIAKYNLESFTDAEQLVWQLVVLVLQSGHSCVSYKQLIENLLELYEVLRELPGTPQSKTEYSNRLNNVAEQVLDSLKRFSE